MYVNVSTAFSGSSNFFMNVSKQTNMEFDRNTKKMFSVLFRKYTVLRGKKTKENCSFTTFIKSKLSLITGMIIMSTVHTSCVLL